MGNDTPRLELKRSRHLNTFLENRRENQRLTGSAERKDISSQARPRKDLSLTDVVRGRLKTSDDDISATRILFELVSRLDSDSSQEEEDDQIEVAIYFDELVQAQQRNTNFGYSSPLIALT
jgi:hypothetical protein